MNKSPIKEELLNLLDKLTNPNKYNLSEEDGDKALIDFCSKCPDPLKARWLLVECLDPMTAEEIVNLVLEMTPRRMADVPTSELPSGHPLRLLCP